MATASRTNSDYMVLIQTSNMADGTSPISVAAPLPESFMFDSTSNYEAPFAQGLFSNNMLRLASAAMGFKTATQALTVQLWQGSSETDLGLELDFQTESDPLVDVRDPILNLLRLTTPIADPNTGLLKSPGPHLDDELLQIGQDIKNDAEGIFQKAVAAAGSVAKVAGLNNTSTSVNGSGSTTQAKSQSVMTTQYWKQRIKNQISIQIGNYMFFDSVVITNVQQTYTSNIDKLTGWPHHARVAVRFRPLFMVTAQDLDTIFIQPRTQAASGSGALADAATNALRSSVGKIGNIFS